MKNELRMGVRIEKIEDKPLVLLLMGAEQC